MLNGSPSPLSKPPLLFRLANNLFVIRDARAPAEAKRLADLRDGDPVKVRVASVDVGKRRILLELLRDEDEPPLIEKMEAGDTALEGGKVVPVRRPAKPFQVCQARVLGAWRHGKTSPFTTAELRLSGGTIGRLHVSELDEASEGSTPMLDFLEKYTSRTVEVKVISVGNRNSVTSAGRNAILKKSGTTRFVDCTMRRSKIAEPRRKLRLVDYERSFERRRGERIRVFVGDAMKMSGGGGRGENNKKDGSETAAYVRAEVNPLLFARIPRVYLDLVKPTSRDAADEDASLLAVAREPAFRFANGELLRALVISQERAARRAPIVNVALGDSIVKEEAAAATADAEEAPPTTQEETRNSGSRASRAAAAKSAAAATAAETRKRRRRRSSASDLGGDDAAAAADEEEENEKEDEIPDDDVKPFDATTMSVQDPGFDFSLGAFSMANMAKVGGGHVPPAKKRARRRSEEHEEAKNVDEQSTEVKEEPQEHDAETLARRERRLADQRKRLAEAIPESALDFDRLITATPNSSDLWIKYITHFLREERVQEAREIAERALRSVGSRAADEELFNLWTAYLNLEAMYGDPTTRRAVFERAAAAVDSLRAHKQMARILAHHGQAEELDEHFETMLRRFKHEDLDVWFMYAVHLYEADRFSEARELLQRALSSLNKKHHLSVLSRFGQMEYRYGDRERGKTIFEKVLQTYPKKTDVWLVYMDMCLKYEGIAEARKLFQRAVSCAAEESAATGGTHRLRLFYERWLRAEERVGDEEAAAAVREQASALRARRTNRATATRKSGADARQDRDEEAAEEP